MSWVMNPGEHRPNSELFFRQEGRREYIRAKRQEKISWRKLGAKLGITSARVISLHEYQIRCLERFGERHADVLVPMLLSITAKEAK